MGISDLFQTSKQQYLISNSFSLSHRLVTSAGWNDVLEPLLVTPPDCDPHHNGLPNGNCGHPFVAIVYFVSFIIIHGIH